jgi:hypothetical protein
VKLWEMLKKTWLRVSGGEDDESKPIDTVDARATIAANSPPGFGSGGAPPNWVPTQQDDRPRH